MFGLGSVANQLQGTLLAVGAGPARLVQLPGSRLLSLAQDPCWQPEVAGMVDDWIERISRASIPPSPFPRSAGLTASSTFILRRDSPSVPGAGFSGSGLIKPACDTWTR